MMLYRLLDDMAERYLDLVDDLNEEIDQLEDRVESLPPTECGSGCRSCATTCCRSGGRSARPATPSGGSSTTSSRFEDGTEVFPHDVEVAMGAVYDKLLRSLDGARAPPAT